jgi:hypothetical protein
MDHTIIIELAHKFTEVRLAVVFSYTSEIIQFVFI